MSREVEYNYVLKSCEDSCRCLTIFLTKQKTIFKQAKYLAVETYDGAILSVANDKLKVLKLLYPTYDINSDVEYHFNDMNYRIRYGKLSDDDKERLDDMPNLVDVVEQLESYKNNYAELTADHNELKERYETLEETFHHAYIDSSETLLALIENLVYDKKSDVLISSIYDRFIHDLGISSDFFNTYISKLYWEYVEFNNDNVPYKLKGWTFKDDAEKSDKESVKSKDDQSPVEDSNLDGIDDNSQILKTSKNSHNHDPIEVFYKKYIKLKEGVKSSLEIIYKYFQNSNPDISYEKFIEGFKLIEKTRIGEIQVDGEYLVGGIYSKNSAYELDKDFTPIERKQPANKANAKTHEKIDDISDESHISAIKELYKTLPVSTIQAIHYPQYSIKQIEKITKKSSIKKQRNSFDSIEILRSYNGEKTVKELAELTGMTEANIRNKTRIYNIPFKKARMGNPNSGKKKSESSKIDTNEDRTDIIVNRFIENHFIQTNNIQDSVRMADAKIYYNAHCEKLEVIPDEHKFMIAMREKFKPNTKFTAYVFCKYVKE